MMSAPRRTRTFNLRLKGRSSTIELSERTEYAHTQFLGRAARNAKYRSPGGNCSGTLVIVDRRVQPGATTKRPEAEASERFAKSFAGLFVRCRGTGETAGSGPLACWRRLSKHTASDGLFASSGRGIDERYCALLPLDVATTRTCSARPAVLLHHIVAVGCFPGRGRADVVLATVAAYISVVSVHATDSNGCRTCSYRRIHTLIRPESKVFVQHLSSVPT